MLVFTGCGWLGLDDFVGKGSVQRGGKLVARDKAGPGSFAVSDNGCHNSHNLRHRRKPPDFDSACKVSLSRESRFPI